ncbi:glycoside hydrolase family 3 C-terminal domain-containing protein [Streptomyces roseirectus]|uniref:Glycoside hydrolase family 3 C-terminal domain-containing protein n=1 Tax=Streptomyces roseirectus TaxID=2768066 RepID=A0A7H0I6Y0_9ACTN|nr:glycoside hydrolase family 3 C-terminal domain-containing protein [Streptomyces roseirectus]QNP68546.1 glycoside hydrolase family 3 C-terminal domain-containing protein [Streptomyces roseirectus]
MADPTPLDLDTKTALLSGRDMWTTESTEAAGVPSLLMCDGPHGVRKQSGGATEVHDSEPATCFPPAVALASSWDPELLRGVGEALGREARAQGVDVLLGPGVNIKRSPLCGRNFEYFSEDPLLSGVLGAAHVSGVQSQGVGASVKHFAANNQETDRMRVSADVDERALREIYLPAFERIVKEARPATVMAAYNRVNGVHATQHRALLAGILREEWGFDGLVVSDWGAVADRVAALVAGTDLEMPGTGGRTDAEVAAAVREGRLDEAVVDTAVGRLRELARRVRAESGADGSGAAGSDTKGSGADGSGAPGFDVDAHHRLAREAAADCLVLLKNDDGTLPLAPATRIAVLGEFARRPRYQGGGSSHVNATRVDSPLDELRLRLPDARVDFTDDPAQAADADVAVVFAGLREEDESEGFDREHLRLPADQVELIRAAATAAPRTVVVLLNGGVVSLEEWYADVDAVVEAWLPGQAGGGAIADVLSGRVNPSGRLAETVPLRLQDTPAYLNFPGGQGHVRYGEGVMVGYRYYESAEVAVRHPFGHGLSYTSFEETGFRVERTGADTATVSVTVTNTGGRFGKHVVQVYVAPAGRPVVSPVRELRAFTKVALAPGESTVVELPLERRAFAFWDIERGDWTVSAGRYEVQLGRDAHTVLASVGVELAGDRYRRPLTVESPVSEWFAHDAAGPALRKALAGGRMVGDDVLRMIASMPMRQFLAFLPEPLPQGLLEELSEA